MILIDNKGHIVSDKSFDELHKFAQRIGLKREWFQKKRIPHYDATTESMIQKAKIAGAYLVTSVEIVRRAIR
jgi:hypothetical protein